MTDWSGSGLGDQIDAVRLLGAGSKLIDGRGDRGRRRAVVPTAGLIEASPAIHRALTVLVVEREALSASPAALSLLPAGSSCAVRKSPRHGAGPSRRTL